MSTQKGFLSKKGIEYEIVLEDGTSRTVHFYPISVLRLSSLRDIVSAASQSMMVLSEKAPLFEDAKTVIKKDGDFSETVQEPPSIEHREKRHARRALALENLLTVLLHEANTKTVAQLLMSSLKDDVPKDQDPLEFLDDVEVSVLPQLFKGFVKANKKVLPAPLQKRALAIWESALLKMEADKNESQALSPEPNEAADSPPSSEALPTSDADSLSLSLVKAPDPEPDLLATDQ